MEVRQGEKEGQFWVRWGKRGAFPVETPFSHCYNESEICQGGGPVKRLLYSKNAFCFLLIFLCFWGTSCGYLSWMYRLMGGMDSAAVDFHTDVTAYLFQAAGVAVFAGMTRRRPALAGKKAFAAAMGADLLATVGAVLAPGTASALALGFGMNLLHGVVAGFYLDRLARTVEWQRRGLVFGLGYGAASVAGWLLSLPGEGNFLGSPWVLGVYAVLFGGTCWLVLRATPETAGETETPESGEPPRRGVLVLGAAAVLLLSVVNGLGFSFPAADISQGISLELSRVFYAVGLIVAGAVSDRERRYGAICCAASLSVPFLMIALAGELGPSIVLWILNYLLFGFFTVFRVLLFTDIAGQDRRLLPLAGFGLLFGRLGDAAGSLSCLLLGEHTVVLVVLAAVLFAGAIGTFLLLYQRVYLPQPLREKSQQERFDDFARQYGLSGREQEVLGMILSGRSTPEMADELFVSERTVKFHIHNLLKKTGCVNRASLLALYRSL